MAAGTGVQYDWLGPLANGSLLPVSAFVAISKRHDHPDLETVVRICLATGARWSEAESLKKSQLAKYKITYIKSKGRKNRTVPISDELYKILPKVRTSKVVFTACYSAFRGAIERAENELRTGSCHTYYGIHLQATL